MSRTRIHTVAGGIDVDITIEHDDLCASMTRPALNPYSSLVSAIRSVAGSLGVPVVEIIRLIEQEESA